MEAQTFTVQRNIVPRHLKLISYKCDFVCSWNNGVGGSRENENKMIFSSPPHCFLLCHSEVASIATFSPGQLGMRYDEEITHLRRTFGLFFLSHCSSPVT